MMSSTRKLLFLLLVLLAGLIGPAASRGQDRPTTTVRVDVSDSYGHAVAEFHLKLNSDDGEVVVDRDVRTGENIVIRPGLYHLTCSSLGMVTLRRSITVEREQKQQWVRLSLWLPIMGDPQPDVVFEGRIVGFMNRAEPVWLRLFALYGDLQREELVGRNSKVVVNDLKLGKYLVVLLQGARVLQVQQVDLAPGVNRYTLKEQAR